MQLQPVWKSAAFWTTVVGAIVAIVSGLKFEMEAEMIGAVAALIIGYLVSRGIVAKAVVAAAPRVLSNDGTPEESEDVRF